MQRHKTFFPGAVACAGLLLALLLCFLEGMAQQATNMPVAHAMPAYTDRSGFKNLTSLANAPSGLLAIYALAFDNDPASAMNLAVNYTPTIQGIVSATIAAPEKTAIVLADREGFNDTQLLVIRNGTITPVAGLPDYDRSSQSAFLNPALHELDMANGFTLGALIAWARQFQPAEATLFSFIGHGGPLVPEPVAEAIDSPVGTPTPAPTATPAPPGIPLPPRWAAHAGLTDYHSASLLSVHDLAVALRIGTNEGQAPLAVLDLLHCFSASVEELYEVHPYAATVVASPNYAYSQPEMIGTALQALQGDQTPVQMAKLLVAHYDQALPAEGHPRLMLAVESNKVSAIKAAWDQTAYHLKQAFEADAAGAKTKIAQAYSASAKYDTTLCDSEDWRLEPPDALSDMADFAGQLSSAFGATSPVSAWAITTTQRISEAILARVAHNGAPWFVEKSNVPTWTFDAPGIALFTDFAPATKNNALHFSWQARWYTYTVNTGNPHPYTFLQNSQVGVTWADIFQRYWAGATISSTRCLPSFIFGRGVGELAVSAIQPSSGNLSLRAGSAVTLSATIHTVQAATNPLVRFTVLQNGLERFNDVVGAGWLEAGATRTLSASRRWTPPDAGEYLIRVLVDVDNRFVEANEEDNRREQGVQVAVVTFLPMVRGGASSR